MPIIDTSGNTVHGSGSFTFIGTQSDLLYRALIKPIRDLDEQQGNLFVKRFLQRPQEIHDEGADAIADLSLTDSPVTCREDLLQYLKAHVGFTAELDYITNRLSAASLRKLIQVAVPLWKRKGTQDGLATVVRLLTGRTPLYIDWFQFRNILGETQIGEDMLGNDSWIIGGEVTLNDEFTSHLRLMDDGTLDEQLLLDLLSLFRPLSERLEVALLDHLDRFDQLTLDRWSAGNQFAVKATLDTTTKEMVVAAGQDATPVTPRFAAPEDITEPTASFKFKLAAANSNMVVTICDALDSLNYIYVTINANTITVGESIAGVDNVLTTFTHKTGPIPIVPACYYALRVETLTVAGGTRVRVFIDSSKLVEVTSVRPAEGTLQVLSVSGGGFRMDNFEMHAGALRFAMIKPTGITQTANFIA
jgi:phage tail-like protein